MGRFFVVSYFATIGFQLCHSLALPVQYSALVNCPLSVAKDTNYSVTPNFCITSLLTPVVE